MTIGRAASLGFVVLSSITAATFATLVLLMARDLPLGWGDLPFVLVEGIALSVGGGLVGGGGAAAIAWVRSRH